MDASSPDPAAALRRAGLRVTVTRLAVFTALAGNAPHSSVDVVVSAVRERLGDGSPQTVYNVLHTLTGVGLVRRIEPDGRPGLYELRTGDNHHHLVCRCCDAITDVDCATGDAPCLTAADNSGYEIDEAEVIYWGRCPTCVAAAAMMPSAASPPHRAPHRAPHRPGVSTVNPNPQRSRAAGHQKNPSREEHDQRVR